MTRKENARNQGIIVSGGTFTANDVAVGRNALITKVDYSQAPLSSVPSLLQGERLYSAAPNLKLHDVFISHASEDKTEIVRPLATALREKSLDVWFDEFELRIGDSLRQKIDSGLANSRLGVVVLSRAFLKKGWTNYELDGMISRAITGEQILLPIWHNITKQEVLEFSPSLADRLARSTATHSIKEIAQEIYEFLQQPAP